MTATNDAQSNDQTGAAGSSTKLAYDSPSITELGDVRELTFGADLLAVPDGLGGIGVTITGSL